MNDTTKDKTAYFNDCSDIDLDIPEEVPTQIRVCAQDLGCTEWRSVNA